MRDGNVEIRKGKQNWIQLSLFGINKMFVLDENLTIGNGIEDNFESAEYISSMQTKSNNNNN